MTTIQELITEAQRAGIAMAAVGDRLRIKAPLGALTPELKATLSARKPELLAVLWRLEGMRTNPEPLPTAKGATAACGGPGHCFSCGDPHEHPDAYGRCEWCWRAVELFYAERNAEEADEFPQHEGRLQR